MERLRHILWLFILFEVGAILIFLPWLRVWEFNYFLGEYPWLRPILLHPSLRGAITGLGALDLVLAIDLARTLMRPKAARIPGA